MSHSSLLDALRDLRLSVLSGQTELESGQQEFERLAYLLNNVSPADERTLATLVNDLERIRFTLLPDDQRAAFDEVYAQADAVFERCT